MNNLTRRVGVLVASAALTFAALTGFAGAAQAESPILGTLTLSQTSGSVSDTPFVANATTSAGCPTGYGQNASLRVGPVGGQSRLLGPIGSAGNYDTVASITLPAARSLTTALGAAPADGDYEVIINCAGVPVGTHPKTFSTLVTVSGSNWQVKAAVATSTDLQAKPWLFAFEGQQVTLTANVSRGAAGTVEYVVDGSSIGTAPVVDGKSVLKTRALPNGLLQVKAKFTPDDPRLFKPSVSAICYIVIG
ncbi:hypothetical protein ACIBF5_08520 [Micromonospora sp. NPDC050417]|uniref:hypothetical protein n=1 Tax=Micromonospora sp. NPDC050417 TaxID=3364280 RepID=UPI0037A05C0D